MASSRLFKPEIRIIGLDDTPFISRSKGKLEVIGVVFRGGYWLEGVIKTEITNGDYLNIADFLRWDDHGPRLHRSLRPVRFQREDNLHSCPGALHHDGSGNNGSSRAARGTWRSDTSRPRRRPAGR